MKRAIFLCTIGVLFATGLQGQNRAQDSLAIIKATLDYIDGHYTGDPRRMPGTLHSERSEKMKDSRPKDVLVTHIFRNAATAKIRGSGWVGYFRLIKWHGRWVVVNAL